MPSSSRQPYRPSCASIAASADACSGPNSRPGGGADLATGAAIVASAVRSISPRDASARAVARHSPASASSSSAVCARATSSASSFALPRRALRTAGRERFASGRGGHETLDPLDVVGALRAAAGQRRGEGAAERMVVVARGALDEPEQRRVEDRRSDPAPRARPAVFPPAARSRSAPPTTTPTSRRRPNGTRTRMPARHPRLRVAAGSRTAAAAACRARPSVPARRSSRHPPCPHKLWISLWTSRPRNCKNAVIFGVRAGLAKKCARFRRVAQAENGSRAEGLARLFGRPPQSRQIRRARDNPLASALPER